MQSLRCAVALHSTGVQSRCHALRRLRLGASAEYMQHHALQSTHKVALVRTFVELKRHG